MNFSRQRKQSLFERLQSMTKTKEDAIEKERIYYIKNPI